MVISSVSKYMTDGNCLNENINVHLPGNHGRQQDVYWANFAYVPMNERPSTHSNTGKWYRPYYGVIERPSLVIEYQNVFCLKKRSLLHVSTFPASGFFVKTTLYANTKRFFCSTCTGFFISDENKVWPLAEANNIRIKYFDSLDLRLIKKSFFLPFPRMIN